jgi:hypothetical protein
VVSGRFGGRMETKIKLLDAEFDLSFRANEVSCGDIVFDMKDRSGAKIVFALPVHTCRVLLEKLAGSVALADAKNMLSGENKNAPSRMAI